MEKYRFTEEMRAAYESLKQPFAIYQFLNKRVVTLILSDGFCELFGYEDKARAYYDMDNDMYKDTHPDDAARIADAAFRFATEGGRYEVIYRTGRKDGSGYRIIHAFGKHVDTEDGVRLAHVWYADEGTYTEEPQTDEPRLKRAMTNALHEESMLKASSYDYLTGLPNMTYFFERAEMEKELLLEKGGQPVLLYTDFSGMKFFNARHGFAKGNEMLQAFARLLGREFSNENSCRIGSDHFAVVTEETGLEEKLERMIREFGKLFDGKTPPVHVGIYPHRMGDVSASSACDRAKLACTGLRGSYSSAYHYYSEKLLKEAWQKQYIVENLDTAIREKWIQVYFQPIIRAVNGQVCDVETLARWVDPVRGVLSPASFIPVLEEAGLICQLDLYMVDRVLEMIQTEMAEGFQILPHSINLSRSDFDACDIVEEIRKRVDAAGIRRDRITVEITESVIGRDYDFMKEQIERFRAYGFPVWMDDFGNGYSSLDVLEGIKFDLIKFDMSFLRRLDEGDEARIVLTELIRMVTFLGVDTVCEGVETEAQVRFLKEIGCSKLQGYYFTPPVPFETFRSMRTSGTMITTENPEEAGYHESIGRLNLYDLDVISLDNKDSIHSDFNLLPIGIVEVKGDSARFLRSNQSYRDFIQRFLGVELSYQGSEFTKYSGPFMNNVVKTCCEQGQRAFYDERMPDGSIVHSFARRIAANPVTGSVAVAIAVLSVSEPEENTTYAEIARSLAADYYNIYVIDLDTDQYTEYSSQVGEEELSVKRRGEDFFEESKRETMTRIYEEDREPFLALFTKENVLRDLDTQGVFTTTYRLIDSGTPVYVNMKITRMLGGNRIILGVSIIDAQMKQREEAKQLRQERIALGRIAALAGNYIALYVVDPVTEHFVEFSSSEEYSRLGLTEQGEEFFAKVKEEGRKVLYPEDMERLLYVLTKENVLQEIRRNGIFIYNYRLLIEGKYVPVSLRATMVREEDGEKIILGVNRLFAKEPTTNASEIVYTHIAHALARGYTELFYVNIETDEFIEYHTDDHLGVLTEARRGADFFESVKRDVKLFVHPEDNAKFVQTLDRDYLKGALGRSKTVELTYRRLRGGEPFYVKMNISRMEDDERIIVIAVSDIDELMRQRQAEKRIKDERVIYARLHALTGNFVVVYVVDPETGRYREFSATVDYEESFAQAKEGTDFFATVREAARNFNHPDDLDRFLSSFTEENVMAEIGRSGIYTLGYRLMNEGTPRYVQLKAATVEEQEGLRLIVGINDVDAQVRQEKEQERRLEQAQSQVNIDALTGVKNKHAYLEAEKKLDRQISEHQQPKFAVTVLDVNDLKKINDTAGHQMGDQRLREACRVVCKIFDHSPVFRFGGDEFVVISQGEDYERIEMLNGMIAKHNQEALRSGAVVVACGSAVFEDDESVEAVFQRADHNMYKNKMRLKANGIGETV